MSLFNLKKKYEINCSKDCTEKKSNENLSIKVLGSGCKTCHAMYENAKQAVAFMGINTKVDYITDMQIIMEYGVMSMPALVVNERVVSQGRLLKPTDIEALLR